jgi:hypothetical protein
MGPQDYVYAADTTNVQAGGSSIFDAAADAVKIGGGSAVISGWHSIYNTGVDVANFFGADAERVDTQKYINDIDQNWGSYYKANKNVIDTVGFIGTSFVPGGLAVKGLNALRRGESAGAFARSLNFASAKQTRALDAALQDLASVEGTIGSRLNKNTIAALGWGVADNVLQTAAFELATVATMKASPLLDGEDWKHVTYDIVKTSLFGGVFAGGIEGLLMNRITKDASKAISAQGNKYQNMLTAFDRTALEDSDKAYAIADNVLALPKEVFENDKILDFTYKLNGQERKVALDTAGLRDKQLQTTIHKSLTKLEETITTHLADDPSVGKGLADAVLKLVKDGRGAGKTDEQIRARVGDYLHLLESVEGASLGSLRREDIFYFDKTAKIADDVSPFSSERKNVSDKVFRIVGGDLKSVKQVTLGLDTETVTVKDAWEQGYDLAFKPNGTYTVNPASQRLREIVEPSTLQSFLRVDSGATSETAVLSAADIATKQTPLQVFGDLVRAGDRQFKFSTEKLPEAADSIEHSARHLWASKLERIKGTVDESDISVLDRMSSAKHLVDDDVTIKLNGVEQPVPWRDLGNFDEWVFNNKIDKLRILADKGEFNVTEAAYALNTTPHWIQNVIASKFETQLQKQATGAPDVTSGWQRELASYANRDTIVLNYKNLNQQQINELGQVYQIVPRGDMITGPQQEKFLLDSTGNNTFITGQQAYAYRVKLAKEQLNNAFSSVFGEDGKKFVDFSFEQLSGLADQLGAGAGLVSFANADYGDMLRLLVQHTGKEVHLLTQKYSNANLTRLQPFLAQLKNSPQDSGELVAIVTKLRRSPENFTIFQHQQGIDDAGNLISGTYLIDKNIIRDKVSLQSAIEQAATGTQGDTAAFRIRSQLVSDFLREHMDINREIVQKRKVLLNAQGITSNIPEDTLHAPPIDTRKIPYFAFVRPIEGKIFGDSNVSMITAKNAEELQRLAAQVDTKQFQVIFKKESEAFHKAKGDYEYSRGFNESTVNSGLHKAGKLGDFLPSFEPTDVLEDFVQYHQRAASQLVRDGVSTKYSQTFTELRRLSEQFTLAATSKAEPISKLFQRNVQDPFDDYIKTALDISKRSEFTLLHQTNEFIDAVGTRAYAAVDAARDRAFKGKITWQEANSELERFGLSAPFEDAHSFAVAQTVADRNLIKTALQKANMALATVTLRFDAANSLMNVISTPIMLGTELASIRRSVANDPALAGKLAELTSELIPGGAGRIPSTTRLVYDAIKNYWGPDSKALIERYIKNGDIKDVISQYHEMVDDLSLLPKLVPSEFSKKADKWTERVATGFGNNFAEQFTRFVSADVMRQITEPLVKAGKMGVAEQNAYMSVFVNRVQGNYIASQRPILFQGTLGSALGLFQTYQFNLLQQLFRHIENRDLKTVAVMGGLQTSLFGLNGLPLFDAINTNIIGNASINAGHRDIYSTVAQANKEAGDWLMYGTASALPIFNGKGPALYTRGDINPRHASIIPITPLDVPAVDGTIRFATNLVNIGKKLAAGGNVGASLMEGLEHNSVSRPLAGLAQAFQGYSTTSKGSLIAASNDFWSVANASRVLGAKPLDESVLLNTKFRSEAYKAADREAISILGSAIKTKLRGNQAPTDEEMQDFVGKYAAHGGRVENFSSALQSWSRDANQSILNTLANQVRSPYGQRMVEVMGGERMDDYRNLPPSE